MRYALLCTLSVRALSSCFIINCVTIAVNAAETIQNNIGEQMKAISLPIRDTFVPERVGAGVWCLHGANLLSRKRYINHVQCKQRQINQRLHYCGFQKDIKHVR